jgi:hypothetical protein
MLDSYQGIALAMPYRCKISHGLRRCGSLLFSSLLIALIIFTQS